MNQKIESQISSIPRPLPALTEEQVLSLAIPTDQRITPSDNFFIDSMYYSGTQGYVEVTYRLLKPDGNIISGILTSETLRLNDATLKTTIISPVIEGSLISLTARFYGASITLGTCYVQVGLFSGSNATTGKRLTVYVAGYLNTVKCLSFPAHRPNFPYDNSNHQRFLGSFSGALPYYLTPPAYTRWKNIVLYCSVTTSAVAANRNFYCELEHTAGTGGGMFMSQVQQPASISYYYTLKSGPSASALIGTNRVDVNMPGELITTLGGRFKVEIDNRQAGDTVDWVRVYAEEILEN